MSRIMAVTASHRLMSQKDKGKFMKSFLDNYDAELYLASVFAFFGWNFNQ